MNEKWKYRVPEFLVCLFLVSSIIVLPDIVIKCKHILWKSPVRSRWVCNQPKFRRGSSGLVTCSTFSRVALFKKCDKPNKEIETQLPKH